VSNPHPTPTLAPMGVVGLTMIGAYKHVVTVLISDIYIMVIIFVISMVITGFKMRLFPTHHLKMSTVIKVLIHCLVLLRDNVILNR
jgi:hypothetical protein